jgi:hypothetical protein
LAQQSTINLALLLKAQRVSFLNFSIKWTWVVIIAKLLYTRGASSACWIGWVGPNVNLDVMAESTGTQILVPWWSSPYSSHNSNCAIWLTFLPGHSLNANSSFWFHLCVCSRSSIEENHSKLLSKLAKQAAGGCVQGTFAPVWQVLRTSAEKLSNLHMQMVQKVSELVKEVSKYADELHKKHKTVCLYPFYILCIVVGSHCTRNISSIINI